MKERRSDRRYPIHADLQYSLRRYRFSMVGKGKTVNVSSHGVLFESDAILPPNMAIQLRIDWPARLNDQVRLRLHADGRVVRVEDKNIAVEVSQYSFHTLSTAP